MLIAALKHSSLQTLYLSYPTIVIQRFWLLLQIGRISHLKVACVEDFRRWKLATNPESRKNGINRIDTIIPRQANRNLLGTALSVSVSVSVSEQGVTLLNQRR